MKKLNFSVWLAISILLLFSFAVSGSNFDRAAEHASRLRNASTTGYRSELLSNSSSHNSLSTDLLLSETVSPARFDQDRPSIVQIADGNWLVAWSDNRNGSEKIFWQKFNVSGDLVGTNTLVASSSVGADYVEPQLERDGTGRVFLIYRDRSNGLILGQRFSPTLVLETGPFLINDTTGDAFAGLFDAAVFTDGRLVVVWEDYASSINSIQLHLYDPTGGTLIGPIAAHSSVADNARWAPAVAVDPSTGFLVAWEDYGSGNADILARLFTGTGGAIGTDFSVVPSPANGFAQFLPAVTFSTNDKYVLVWVDQRQGQEVYAQRYDAVNGLIGSNTRISSGDTLQTTWDVDIIAQNPNVLISWANFSDQNMVLVRPVSGGLTPQTTKIVNQGSEGQRWAPTLFLGTSNRYGVTWVDVPDNPDIHAMLFNTSGSRVFDADVILNNETSGAPKSQPSVVTTSSWWNLAVFGDKRSDAGDIYFQAFTHGQQMPIGNVRVNQDSTHDLQLRPSITTNGNSTLISWIDNRAVGGVPGQRIFGRFCDVVGNFAGNEFLISESANASAKQDLASIISNSNQTLVAWIDRRSGPSRVYGRWLQATPEGSEFQISTSGVDIEVTKVVAGRDGADNLIVLWLDNGSVVRTIRGKWYLPNRALGGSFSWAPSLAGVSIEEFAASVGVQDQNIHLLWTGNNSGNRNAYYTSISKTGVEQVANKLVNDNALAYAEQPAISVDNNGYITTAWIDHRTGKGQLYSQIYSPGATAIGANDFVASASPEYMTQPSLSANRGRVWFSWIDPRANGDNVYATSVVYSPTDAGDDYGEILPNSYALYQNYPNPFNPTTTISFALPERSEITLRVYNSLGQQVRSLLTTSLSAGEHSITWDGKSDGGEIVASGVYWYRLQTGTFVESKSMLLLK